MKKFQNILCVVQENGINDNILQQLANLAKPNNAEITFLVLQPALSENLAEVKKAFEKGMTETIRTKLAAHNVSQNSQIIFDTQIPHFLTIIQHVQKGDFDLVLKAAEDMDGKSTKGFKSVDMNLLRKCPSPIWLCREMAQGKTTRILTAIDPSSDTPEGQELSIKLLKIGNNLAETLSGKNEVISCWEYEYENFLRNSAFCKMENEKVDVMVQEEEKAHQNAVKKIIAESGISPQEVHSCRGRAYETIPKFIEENQIDILVMGTVARTGIPGFLIGNTAENIVQNIKCGMFAVKPSGFVSPIKAY